MCGMPSVKLTPWSKNLDYWRAVKYPLRPHETQVELPHRRDCRGKRQGIGGVAARDQFLHQQAGHDGLPGARIVWRKRSGWRGRTGGVEAGGVALSDLILKGGLPEGSTGSSVATGGCLTPIIRDDPLGFAMVSLRCAYASAGWPSIHPPGIAAPPYKTPLQKRPWRKNTPLQKKHPSKIDLIRHRKNREGMCHGSLSRRKRRGRPHQRLGSNFVGPPAWSGTPTARCKGGGVQM
jgi:hypothetical protein